MRHIKTSVSFETSVIRIPVTYIITMVYRTQCLHIYSCICTRGRNQCGGHHAGHTPQSHTYEGNVLWPEPYGLCFIVATMAYVSRNRLTPAKRYQRLLHTSTDFHTNQEYLQVSCTLLNLRLRSRRVYLYIGCGNYCFVRSRTITQTADSGCGAVAYIRRLDLVYDWPLTARAMTQGHTFYIGVLTG